MLDCVGAFGVKRLKADQRRHIPGVIGYCRKVFELQLPFDNEFRLDDKSLYCVEMTEKAFRSQGLALSEPVRLGDWQNLTNFPLTAFAIPLCSGLVLEHPITLEQPVYLPGDERHGVWASPLLETVAGPESKRVRKAAFAQPAGWSVRGDIAMVVFVVSELRRSYSELPVRWVSRFALHPTVRELLAARSPDLSGAIAADK